MPSATPSISAASTRHHHPARGSPSGVVGVVAVLIPRWPAIGLVGPLAVAASVLLPLGMTLWDGAAGALQRAMFAVAYVWYADAARGIPADGATGGPD